MRIAEKYRGPLGFAFAVLSLLFIGWLQSRVAADDARDGVHQRMQQILNEEVPADVTGISFNAVGTWQNCILSNKGRDESEGATVPNAPHQAHILGQLVRDGEGWRNIAPGGHGWVSSVQAHQERKDAQAISEPDFRSLIHQCVAAVRQQRHQASTWVLTEAENRATWSAWSDEK